MALKHAKYMSEMKKRQSQKESKKNEKNAKVKSDTKSKDNIKRFHRLGR